MIVGLRHALNRLGPRTPRSSPGFVWPCRDQRAAPSRDRLHRGAKAPVQRAPSPLRPSPVLARRLFAGSGRQGTRRRTGPDRPHRVGERDERQFRIDECFGQVLFRSFCTFHTDLLFRVVGHSDKDVSHYESDHEEDDPEPVQAGGVEPPAADPLRPEPANQARLCRHASSVKATRARSRARSAPRAHRLFSSRMI